MFWNHITKTFVLSVALANLLVLNTFSTDVLAQSKYVKYYQVNDSAPTLKEISIQLYGRTKYWKEIAKWNNIQPPYTVKLNTRLKIHKKPTVSIEKGNAIILEMWRRILTKNNPEPAKPNLNATSVNLPVTQLPPSLPAPPPPAPEIYSALEFSSPPPQAAPTPKIADIIAEEEKKLKEAPEDKLSAEELIDRVTLAQKSKTGNWEDWIQLTQKARSKDPTLLRAWMTEVSILLNHEQFDRAKKVAAEFVKIKPEMSSLRLIKKALEGTP